MYSNYGRVIGRKRTGKSRNNGEIEIVELWVLESLLGEYSFRSLDLESPAEILPP
jgi:hypothetical protein